ncbi:phospholipid-binding protein MlaC [Thiomonas sp. FB-6]|uniref:MlaC/ttg2D family ABC transporter substrate-binding protein n=1 Tax=Thiomonas sp. FB-6 TaxID=1158291 RepID=UPI000372E76C|nr:ABC transporter substrate-binding protein [Thiomonas sp. FB-6]
MFAKIRALFLPAVLAFVAGGVAHADEVAPPVQVVRSLTDSVMGSVRSDPTLKAGDQAKIEQLVQTKVLPYLDFHRMTASAVGPAWRRATPQQRDQLQEQFKQLLIHTYSGAVGRIKNQKVQYLPLRAAPHATSVVVRTRVLDNGEQIQLDYRLLKQGEDWKISDVNVMGVWLVDNYRGVFAQEINSKGIDGLIGVLKQRNEELAKGGQEP